MNRMRRGRVRLATTNPRGNHFDLDQLFEQLNERISSGNCNGPTSAGAREAGADNSAVTIPGRIRSCLIAEWTGPASRGARSNTSSTTKCSTSSTLPAAPAAASSPIHPNFATKKNCSPISPAPAASSTTSLADFHRRCLFSSTATRFRARVVFITNPVGKTDRASRQRGYRLVEDFFSFSTSL